MQIMRAHILKLILCCLSAVLLMTPSQTHASENTSDLVENEAVTLANHILIQSQNVPILNDKTKSVEDITSLPLLRTLIVAAFDSSTKYELDELVNQHEALARQYQSEPDLLLTTYYSSLKNRSKGFFSDNQADVRDAVTLLEPGLLSDNWIVVHQTAILNATLNGYLREFPQSLKLATDSIAAIPKEITEDTQHAKAQSYGVIAYLHCVLKNPEMAVPAIEELLRLSDALDRPVNYSNQMNNLIYAFSGIKDHKTTLTLIEILQEIESNNTVGAPGLTELRASQTYINLDLYSKAFELSQGGLTVVQNATIKRNLRIAEVQALAGLGKAQEARLALAKLKTSFNDSDQASLFVQRELTRADALIAAAEGDAMTAVHLMERYNDLSVQRILKSNNSDTASLLANLENDKIRQQERAQMARLREEALRNRIRIVYALLAAAGILLLIAGATAAFANYRRKVAVKLADAAEAALSGEKAKSQFLAVISHELRTPLNGIIGIADLLSRTAPSQDLRRKIGIINDSGHDLLKLVEQVLDMSRIDAEEMEIFPEYTELRDIISSLDTLWRPTIEKKSIVFTSYVDPHVPNQVMVDPMRLRQCVNNLISNASKFTQKGRIHLHVTATPIEGTDESTIKVIIADTGIGMTQKVQDNLFKPFVQADSSITRQYGGSGLGLAITRSLARMMSGDLTVMSRKDAGTEFTLSLRALTANDSDILNEVDAAFKGLDEDLATINAQDYQAADYQAADYNENADAGLDAILGLYPNEAVSDTSDSTPGDETTDIAIAAPTPPAERKIAAIPQTLAEAEMDDLRNVRILIVEDVPSNTDVMKIFLEPQGCLVMSAENGKVALDALAQQEFDVILMDIRMPEMDGIEATKIIRSRGGINAHVPIIALTADATAETNAQCMAAGADIFLTKPLIATELYDSIRFVRRQALRRAVRKGLVKPSTPMVKIEQDRRSA